MRRSIYGIVFVILLLLGMAYVFGTAYLERTIASRLRHELPPGIRFGDVDLIPLPVSVSLMEVTLGSGPTPAATIGRIQFHLSWRSLTAGTIAVDSVGVHDPHIRCGASIDQPIFDQDPGDADTGFVRFHPGRIEIRRGTVCMIQNPGSSHGTLEIRPINGVLIPSDPTQPFRQISVSLNGHLNDQPGSISARGEILPGSGDVWASGSVSLRDLSVTSLQSLTPPGIQLKEGSIRGQFSLNATPRGLRIERIPLRLRNLRLRIDSPAGPASRDVDEPDPRDRSPSPPEMLEVDTISLKSGPARVEYVTQNETPVVEVAQTRADVQFDRSGTRPVVFKTRLDLTRPRGQIQAHGWLRSPGDTPVLTLLTWATVETIAQLNPFLGSDPPFRFKQGSLRAAVKGIVSRPRLDLNVELGFWKMTLDRTRTPNSTFLGIPTAVFLRYLSDQGGQLRIQFQVLGSWDEPRLDTSSIRQQVLAKLGVDAAVIGALGLPAFAVDQVIEQTTGHSIIGTAVSTLKGLFPEGDTIPMPAPGSSQDTPASSVTGSLD